MQKWFLVTERLKKPNSASSHTAKVLPERMQVKLVVDADAINYYQNLK